MSYVVTLYNIILLFILFHKKDFILIKMHSKVQTVMAVHMDGH